MHIQSIKLTPTAVQKIKITTHCIDELIWMTANKEFDHWQSASSIVQISKLTLHTNFFLWRNIFWKSMFKIKLYEIDVIAFDITKDIDELTEFNRIHCSKISNCPKFSPHKMLMISSYSPFTDTETMICVLILLARLLSRSKCSTSVVDILNVLILPQVI